MSSFGNWGKYESKRGEVIHSMSVVLQDAFQFKDMRFEVHYTSNMYLAMWLETNNSDFLFAPKRKILKFRSHPSFSKVWDKIDQYFPGLMTIEMGDRFSFDGDEILVGLAKSRLIREIDREWFEKNKEHISSGSKKILRTKNQAFKEEWKLDSNYILLLNGVEHFVAGNKGYFWWISKDELVERFRNFHLELKQVVEDNSLVIKFAQPHDARGYAFVDLPEKRDYFYFQDVLSVGLISLLDTVIDKRWTQFEPQRYRNTIIELFRSAGKQFDLTTTNFSLALKIPDKAVALLSQLANLPKDFASVYQHNLKKVTILDRDRKVKASIKPIHTQKDGTHDWGPWLVRQRSEAGNFFTFEAPTAFSGILRVVGNASFTLHSKSKLGDGSLHSQFFGRGITLSSEDGSWRPEVPEHFQVKPLYVIGKKKRAGGNGKRKVN